MELYNVGESSVTGIVPQQFIRKVVLLWINPIYYWYYFGSAIKIITPLAIKVITSVLISQGKSYRRGRFSTVDLLMLTSLDQLFLYRKYY